MKTGLSHMRWPALLLCVWPGLGATTETSYNDVVIQKIDTVKNTIAFSGEPKPAGTILVADQDIQIRLPQLHEGDHLSIVVADENGKLTLRAMVLKQSRVEPRDRIRAFGGALLVWLLLGLALAKGKVLGLIKGEDGRYSNSKFQAVVWFSVVIVTYGATVVLRSLRLGVDLMWIDIPPNLLMLSGLSAFSFGAAKGITTSKIETAQAAGFQAPKTTISAGLLVDLTTNDDNQLDLGDFQMLVVTLLAVASYAVIAFHSLGALEASKGLKLQDVDTTILASFGLGQGAYLAKKALGQVGLS